MTVVASDGAAKPTTLPRDTDCAASAHWYGALANHLLKEAGMARPKRISPEEYEQLWEEIISGEPKGPCRPEADHVESGGAAHYVHDLPCRTP